MNNKLLVFLLGLAWLMSPRDMGAQELMSIADKQYELEAYDLAIQNYEKLLAEDPKNSSVMFSLAECHRISNNYQEALNWYDQLTGLEKFNSLAYLHYGHILKSMGKIDKAKYWYLKYAEINPEVGKQYAESCNKAKELLSEDMKYELSLFAGNSKESDFAPSFVNGKMVFSSFRKDMNGIGGKKNRSLIHKKGNQLFVANSTEVTNPEVALLRPDMKSSFHIGPVAYSGGNNTLVAYTKNNFKNGVKFVRSNDTNMSLFFADKEQDNDFSRERPFPYNKTGFSTGFANFSNQGTTLYFASNRPGGYGGYDIYVSFHKNGSWSIPVNLGEEVNSKGNDITPFYNVESDQLFFSSDYHAGIGGFDVFVSEKLGEYKFGIATNMGNVINSPADDYFFSVNPNSSTFYFSSNRLGGNGLDDIYKASPIPTKEEFLAIEENVPEAVNLDDLAVISSSKNAATVALRDDKAFAENFEPYIADNNFSLSDARLIAKRNVILSAPPSKVYFIQVAALSRTRGDVGIFKRLTSFGNLYKVHKTKSTKIRLGYYYDKNEAVKILSSVKSMGYNDAFIVHEALLTSELELVGDSQSNNSNSESKYKSSFTPAPAVSNYKVRLASYTDPLWFDISRVKDLGEIEQWTKGQYTIFILSGYGSLDNAKRALIKAKNRGFSEAHIVMDNNGYLEKLQQN